MPQPTLPGDDGRGFAAPKREQPRHELDTHDGNLAVALPDWDLLPPAEFLDRHRRR